MKRIDTNADILQALEALVAIASEEVVLALDDPVGRIPGPGRRAAVLAV